MLISLFQLKISGYLFLNPQSGKAVSMKFMTLSHQKHRNTQKGNEILTFTDEL